MDYIAVLLVAVALSMDAMAVSMVAGIKIKKLRPIHVLKPGIFFGVFQSGMVWLGMLAGSFLASRIENFDHWIAFGLLAIVGGKMLLDGIRGDKDGDKDGGKDEKSNPFDTKVLLVLAVATSIDALAVGLSFAFLEMPWLVPGLIIGIVTFALSCGSVVAGKKLGDLLGNKMTIIGGLILIGIGIKILWEHLL